MTPLSPPSSQLHNLQKGTPTPQSPRQHKEMSVRGVGLALCFQQQVFRVEAHEDLGSTAHSHHVQNVSVLQQWQRPGEGVTKEEGVSL